MPAGPLANLLGPARAAGRAIVDHVCTHADDRASWVAALAEASEPLLALAAATADAYPEAVVQLLNIAIIEAYAERIHELAGLLGLPPILVVPAATNSTEDWRGPATAELWNLVLAGRSEDAFLLVTAVTNADDLAQLTYVSLSRGVAFLRSLSEQAGFPTPPKGPQ